MTTSFPTLKKAVEDFRDYSDLETGVVTRAAEILIKDLDRPQEEIDVVLTSLFLAFQAAQLYEDPDKLAADYGADVATTIKDLRTAKREESMDGIGKNAAQISAALALATIEEMKTELTDFDDIIEEWDELPTSAKGQMRDALSRISSNAVKQARQFEDFKQLIDAPRLAARLDSTAKQLLTYFDYIEKTLAEKDRLAATLESASPKAAKPAPK